MALIDDPDGLNQGTEITISTGAQTFTLNEAGGLSADGVLGQALYSFFKEEWKDDPALIKFPFPMLAITPEQFEFGSNGSKFSNWKPSNDATRKLIRTAGWREYDDTGATLREYMGVITLGNIDSTSKTVGDKAYYFFAGDTSATEFDYAGSVNESVQVFGDALNGNFDNRALVFTTRIRVFGKTYDQSTTSDIGVNTMTYKVERFPLSESTDAVISDLGVTTGDIDANPPYTDMSIAYFAAAQNRTGFVGGAADFGVIVDGDVSIPQQDGGGVATAEEIYAYVQRQLLQTSDINNGSGGAAVTVVGQLAEPLLNLASTGNTLSTLEQTTNPGGGGNGVYVDSFNSNDKNRVQFVDDTSAIKVFPFVAAGSLAFNNNLQNDAAARYWLFYRYTRETSVNDLSVTSASGSTATITTGGAVDFTSTGDFGAGALTNGDYIEISGFTNAENNGIWQITSVPVSGSFNATKYTGETVVDESTVVCSLYRSPLNSPDATIVQDNGDTDLGNVLITGNATIGFDYDFDGDVTGGRDITQPAAVALRVIGTTTAQFAEAEFSITRAVGLSFPITSSLERNYINP